MTDHPKDEREFEVESSDSDVDDNEDNSATRRLDLPPSSESVLTPAPESPEDEEEESKEVDLGDNIQDDWYMPDSLVAPNEPPGHHEHQLTPIQAARLQVNLNIRTEQPPAAHDADETSSSFAPRSLLDSSSTSDEKSGEKTQEELPSSKTEHELSHVAVATKPVGTGKHEATSPTPKFTLDRSGKRPTTGKEESTFQGVGSTPDRPPRVKTSLSKEKTPPGTDSESGQSGVPPRHPTTSRDGTAHRHSLADTASTPDERSSHNTGSVTTPPRGKDAFDRFMFSAKQDSQKSWSPESDESREPPGYPMPKDGSFYNSFASDLSSYPEASQKSQRSFHSGKEDKSSSPAEKNVDVGLERDKKEPDTKEIQQPVLPAPSKTEGSPESRTQGETRLKSKEGSAQSSRAGSISTAGGSISRTDPAVLALMSLKEASADDRLGSNSSPDSSRKTSEGSTSNKAPSISTTDPVLLTPFREELPLTATTGGTRDSALGASLIALNRRSEHGDRDEGTPIVQQANTWSSSSESDFVLPDGSVTSTAAVSNEITPVSMGPKFLEEVEKELSAHRRQPQSGTKKELTHPNDGLDWLSSSNDSEDTEGNDDSALESLPGHRRKRLTKLLSSVNLTRKKSDTSLQSDEPGQKTFVRKSKALVQLESNVQHSVKSLLRTEKRKGIKELVASSVDQGKPDKYPSPTSSSASQSCSRLLRGFETLLGALLQLSDELELWSTFARTPKSTRTIVSADAIKAVLSHAPALNQIFAHVNPILEHFLETGVDLDSEIDALMTRAQRLVQLLCDLTYRVCQRQEWNPRAETAFVTLLEIMDRTIVEITSLYEGTEIPAFQMSTRHRRAWVATGHVQELKALFVQTDKGSEFFLQMCYDVLISTDYWCPDTRILGLVCDVGPGQKEDSPPPEDARLAPIPPSALYVLDNIDGEPLQRTAVMTRILRQILPPYAIMDSSIVRTAYRLPHRIGSAGNVVAISSTAEVLNDSKSLGLAGVGKTTVAAMIASHEDVRRFFKDGVVWVHVGSQEMSYRRYTQCLRELCSQLVFYDGVPLFAELLHTPGETKAARTRREEGFMIYARDAVAELLRMRNVLVILDDVMYASDIDWFQFSPESSSKRSCSSTSSSGEGSFYVMVTTRNRNLIQATDTVEIDLLDDEDAMKLFAMESGHPNDHEISSSQEARSIVMECANHPLAIKSVGRWLRLKRATSGVIHSVEEICKDVGHVFTSTIDELVKNGNLEEADMMYEIMNLSFSPFVNGKPTVVIKFCFAAFVAVFCHQEHHSNFLSTGTVVRPVIPIEIADLLFQTLLALEKELLFQEGSPFYKSQEEATLLIPEALSALGVLKVISSVDDDASEHESKEKSKKDQMYLQIIHAIQHEYGEHLSTEDDVLRSLTEDGERRWNRAFAEACLASAGDWDSDVAVASRDYALEMLVSHMLRGELFEEAAAILSDENFVRGRLYSLGPENATRRHILDCEMLFERLKSKDNGKAKEPQIYMEWAYRRLGNIISKELSENDTEEGQILTIEAGRANFEMGFSLAEKRCWKAAISHWEISQKLLVASLGVVEFVAAILFNMGVALSQLNEYERSMEFLKQCLQIRGALHGEEHLLYAQTIQKIGDVFLQMNDYKEALESYSWAMEIATIDSNRNRIDIGELLERMGDLHYTKGEVPQALRFFENALDSKKSDLGEDDPELATIYQHIGNCLSDQGKVEEAVYNFDEAIRLMNLDPNGGEERDATVFSIQGVLHNLNGLQDEGLQCYEKALELLMRAAPNNYTKMAELLHLIGCVYLINGEHVKAMKLFEESLQARRKIKGFVHVDVSSTLFNMAFLHQARNHPKKSLKCLEEALKIRQLRLPESEKVAITHEKIGALAKALRKRHKAEIAFEEALRIRILLHGTDHESVSALLCELGALMDEYGEFAEAMAYYAEALDIRRKKLGDDHESVASLLYSMGFAMYNAGKDEGALHCFDESLIIRKSRLGTTAKEVGDTLNMMGYLNARLGQLDDALSLLLEALAIRKLKDDLIKASETMMNIGNVRREKREYTLSLEAYEECLRLRRSELGDDHDKVIDALIAIGNVHSDMEQLEEAMRSYEEALAIRTAAHGDHDEMVAKIYQYMGMIEFRFGDSHRARQLLEEFVRIRRKNMTDNDGDFVNALFIIGNIHKVDGERYYAKKNWREAYNILQRLGITKENPQLDQALSRLLHAGELTSPVSISHVISSVRQSLKDEKLPPKEKRESKPGATLTKKHAQQTQ